MAGAERENIFQRIQRAVKEANEERRRRREAQRAQRAQEQARREQERRARQNETPQQRRQREAAEAREAQKKQLEEKAQQEKVDKERLDPEQIKKAKETVARKIKEDYEVADAIGEVPEDPRLAFYISQWAEASPEIRGKKEVVDNLIKNIKQQSGLDERSKVEAEKIINNIKSHYSQYDIAPDPNNADQHNLVDLEKGKDVEGFNEAKQMTPFEQERYREAVKKVEENTASHPALEGIAIDLKKRIKTLQDNPELGNEVFSTQEVGKAYENIMNLVGRGDVQLKDAKPYLDLLRAATAEQRPGRNFAAISYKDIKDWDYEGRGRPGHPKDMQPKTKEVTPGEYGKDSPDSPTFYFQSLTQEEVNNFKDGRAGEDEWFWGFIARKESMPRQEMQLGWTELQKLEEFFNYVNWKYGPEEGLNRELVFRQHLDVRPGLHHRLKTLLTEPVNEEHQIEALVVSPDEYSYLMKVSPELSPRAAALYEEATRNVMMRKRLRNSELTFGNKDKGIPTEKERLARMKKIQENAKKSGGFEKLTNAEALEYMELWKQQTEKEYGVMLWANDIQFDADLWRTLQDRKSKQDSLLALIKNPYTSSEDRNRAVGQLLEVQLTQTETEMLRNRGKSAIDVETERLLRLDIANTYRGKNKKDWPSDLDIDLALKAARTYKILTLDALQIASSMADAPETVKGRYRSPSLERLQRIINPELFERRFEVGGAVGNRKRGYHLEQIIEEKKKTDPRLEGKLLDLRILNPKTALERLKLRGETARLEKEYLAKAIDEAKDKKIKPRNFGEKIYYKIKPKYEPQGNYGRYFDQKFRHAEATLRAYENLYGISYDEMLRAGTISIGGPFHQSTWRMESGGYEPLIEQFQAMGKRAEHVALGFQYKVDPFKRGQENIAKEMFERMPHLVNQYAPDKAHEAISKYKNVDAQTLYDVLTTAQMRLSHDKDFEYQTVRVNLSDPDKFDKIVKPILDDIADPDPKKQHELERLVPDQRIREKLRQPDVQEEYRLAIKDLVGIGHELAGSKWRKIQNLPLTLTYSDMDMGREEFFRMGEQAIQRRFAADMTQAYTAMQVLNEFQGGAPELFSPTSDYKKSLERLYEALKAMDGYVGRPTAETVAAQQIEEMLKFNEYKHRWLADWIPGYSWAARNMTFLNKGGLSSDSLEFTGGLGNLWDERQLLEVLNSARDMGFFTQKPQLYFDLQDKFHLGVGYRLLSAARRYWWGVPLLVGFAGISEAIKEDEKRTS